MKKLFILMAIVGFFAGTDQLSAQVTPADTSASSAQSLTDSIPDKEATPKQKKDKKKKDDFKIFGGITFNKLSMNSEVLNPTTATGWNLGVSYRRGRFFYWEIGAVYDDAVYSLRDSTMGSLFDGVFSVRSIEVPITGGINFLSFASRIVGLRVFLGATPGFRVAVGDNNPNVSKDNVNSFNINGHAGVGVDVAFVFVEAGYKYGFLNTLEDIKSNPNQVFVKLGFRF